MSEIQFPSALNRIQAEDSPTASLGFTLSKGVRADSHKEQDADGLAESKGPRAKEDFALPNFYSTCKPDFGSILQSLSKNEKIDGEEQTKLFDIESHIQIRGTR